MKFKKWQKIIFLNTAICTVVLCWCFLGTGAYAAASTNIDNNGAVEHDNAFIENSAPNNNGSVTDVSSNDEAVQKDNILAQDGVYYIFCDGAGENDKPQSAVSEGDVLFVVVRKDSYVSVGPFRNSSTMIYETNKQCKLMIEQGLMTETEKGFVLNAAKKAADSREYYTYVHGSYYSDSYIIGLGWNLDDIMRRRYTESREILLADQSTMTVYFGNLFFGDADQTGNAVDYLNDPDAVPAIGKLIDSLKNSAFPNYPAIETPLVTSIAYVGEKDLSTLAEEFLESNNTAGFVAVFTAMDAQLQSDYCQKLYDKDQNVFFAAIVPYMTESQKQEWLIRAEADQKKQFSAILSADAAVSKR